MKEYMSSIGVQATFVLLDTYKSLTNKLDDELISQGMRDTQFLDTFVELSTNFPRYAHTIPHISVEKYESVLGYLQSFSPYASQMGRLGSRSSLHFNGIAMDPGRLDIFAFFDVLRKESQFVDQLSDVLTSGGHFPDEISKNAFIQTLLRTSIALLRSLSFFSLRVFIAW